MTTQNGSDGTAGARGCLNSFLVIVWLFFGGLAGVILLGILVSIVDWRLGQGIDRTKDIQTYCLLFLVFLSMAKMAFKAIAFNREDV